MTSELRVIAGRWKGAKLSSPQSAATHPMGTREKNALFNMLQPWLKDAVLLDAYAGSGALGVEALSRGAQRVVFVECSPAVVRTLRTNLARVGAESVDVVTGDVASVAGRPEWQGKFDLIVADPPYDRFAVAEIIALRDLLKPDGILALSYPSKLGELELDGFDLLTARSYAAAGIGIYRKSEILC